ncbi:MAG: hypothetical protein OXC11_11080 [Rhodospirillales bacterium]|nr:hypothetical protein [Rhodospirillales bacterium]
MTDIDLTGAQDRALAVELWQRGMHIADISRATDLTPDDIREALRPPITETWGGSTRRWHWIEYAVVGVVALMLAAAFIGGLAGWTWW